MYLTTSHVLLFQYPESVMFRDCSDLNFKEYLDVIKEPIALDVIKEKLDRENPEMVMISIFFHENKHLYVATFTVFIHSGVSNGREKNV